MENQENQGAPTGNENENAQIGIPAQKEEHSVGGVIGIIIIVLILVVAGIYIFSTRKTPTAEEIMGTPDATTEQLKDQNATDTVSSIEADLNATNLDNLTPEVNQIQGQLK